MVDEIISYKSDATEDFYGLLGCDERSDTQQIIAEYRIRALQFHPDKNVGRETEDCAKQFSELQRAKEILTDPVKRADYDRWRASSLAIPYSQWSSMKDGIKTSMHWAVPKQTDPMIEHPNQERASTQTQPTRPQQSNTSRIPWERAEGNEMLRKFRNYEI